MIYIEQWREVAIFFFTSAIPVDAR